MWRKEKPCRGMTLSREAHPAFPIRLKTTYHSYFVCTADFLCQTLTHHFEWVSAGHLHFASAGTRTWGQVLDLCPHHLQPSHQPGDGMEKPLCGGGLPSMAGARDKRGRAQSILTAAIHTEMERACHLLLWTRPLLGRLPDPSLPAAGSARTFSLLGLLKEILSVVFSKI